jgi:hypothetical protein
MTDERKPAELWEAALLRQMAQAMYAVHRRLEFYTEREVNSPSNHQDFAQQAQEELDAFNLALNSYNEWANSNKSPASPPQAQEPYVDQEHNVVVDPSLAPTVEEQDVYDYATGKTTSRAEHNETYGLDATEDKALATTPMIHGKMFDVIREDDAQQVAEMEALTLAPIDDVEF